MMMIMMMMMMMMMIITIIVIIIIIIIIIITILSSRYNLLKACFGTTHAIISFKDPIPDVLKSLVVYQFTCAGCNSRYIRETSLHFATRVNMHLSTDKNSHVCKHLNGSPSFKRKCSGDCFKIQLKVDTVLSSKKRSTLAT